MKEKPILFKGEMVRAILSGQKTMTRRVCNQQPGDHRRSRLNGYKLTSNIIDTTKGLHVKFGHWVDGRTDDPVWSRFPFGRAGDRLWVRETWASVWYSTDHETGYADDWGNLDPTPKTIEDARARGGYPLAFRADNQHDHFNDDRGFKWLPSIFMPRWASRITLEIVGIKVERLQDISNSDAAKEGVESDGGPAVAKNYIDPFKKLWDSINGKTPGKSWRDNPFVWAIEFKIVSP